MTLKLNGTNSEAAPAYAGDDADTGLQCGTNELKLVTGGSARATVDSSGRLLIGTSSASTSHIFAVQGRTSDSTSYANIGLRKGSAPTSSNPTLGVLNFTDNNERQAAYVLGAFDAGTWTDGSSHPGRLVFATAADGASSATERLRITSDGTIKLASGCPGIDFSQIQTNASGMTSETLDSYEEGTFSPFSATQITDHSILIAADAHYVKIGRLVQIWMRVQYTGTSSSAISGNMPFPCSNPTNSASKSPFFLSVFPKSGSSTNMCFAYLGANNTTGFTVYENNNNYGTLNFNDTPNEITITGCYRST